MFYRKIFIHEEEVATASCVALNKQKVVIVSFESFERSRWEG